MYYKYFNNNLLNRTKTILCNYIYPLTTQFITYLNSSNNTTKIIINVYVQSQPEFRSRPTHKSDKTPIKKLFASATIDTSSYTFLARCKSDTLLNHWIDWRHSIENPEKPPRKKVAQKPTDDDRWIADGRGKVGDGRWINGVLTFFGRWKEADRNLWPQLCLIRKVVADIRRAFVTFWEAVVSWESVANLEFSIFFLDV